MKLAILSDIHGNLLALQAVLADVALQDVDQILNLGDIASGPLQPAETLDLLMTHNFLTIAGNHERQLLTLMAQANEPSDPTTSDGYAASQLNPAHTAWLQALPVSLELMEGEVLLCHGTPDSDLQYWLETVVRGYTAGSHSGVRAAMAQEVAQRLGSVNHSLVLCGHTHVPRVVQSGGSLIVNPGSVGLQAYDGVHPWLHHIETGAPQARYALAESGPAGWQITLRQVPYDHLTQAEVARRNGRPDWAHALATGWVLPL